MAPAESQCVRGATYRPASRDRHPTISHTCVGDRKPNLATSDTLQSQLSCTLLHPTTGRNARKHMNLSASNQFPISNLSILPVQVKSPQARFTDHQKQDFQFLVPTLNCKVKQFLPFTSLRLQIPHTPTPHYIFNSLQKIWGESFHPYGYARKS